MRIFRNILGWGAAGVFLVGTAAQAAGQSGSCAFGSCSAHLTGSLFQVTCDGKSVYSGAFELTTDFQVTQIQAATPGGPQIAMQKAPATGAKVNATLIVSGQSTAGTCGFDSN